MPDFIEKQLQARALYHAELIATATAHSALWQGYAEYLSQRERGLRQQALARLERFIIEMEQADFPERRRFVTWLLSELCGRGRWYNLCPHPLSVRIVRPTLLEWTTVDPGSSEPHRLLGGIEHLRRALELNPADLGARKELIQTLLGRVSMDTHEIPHGYGYSGDPQKGLVALGDAEVLVLGLPDAEKDGIISRIEEERSLIEQWLARLSDSERHG